MAWDKVRLAIDNGYPCYGYPLHTIPEIYIIDGYDQCGYCYNGVGVESGTGSRLWKELGLPDQYFEIHIVKLREPEPIEKTIKDALNFVIEFSTTDKRVGPEFKTGPAAYDQWINALEHGLADEFGAAFNPLVWAECRSYAAPFLSEAKDHAPSELHSLFDDAVKHYRNAAEYLQKVSALFPCFTVSHEQREANLKDRELVSKAVTYLRAAKEADSAGLNTLQKIAAGF